MLLFIVLAALPATALTKMINLKIFYKGTCTGRTNMTSNHSQSMLSKQKPQFFFPTGVVELPMSDGNTNDCHAFNIDQRRPTEFGDL
jgi:hypothetical protein